MVKIGKDQFEFVPESQNEYRRFSVREIARIQTFPDDFVFKYSRIADAYKMIGNAVPVALAEAFARRIFDDLSGIKIEEPQELAPGKLFTFDELVQ
jgi:DNA (cytosine-5)-methyltransferase 1